MVPFCPQIVDSRVEVTAGESAPVHVRIVDGELVRELDAPSCDAAVRSVALVLHLLGPHEDDEATIPAAAPNASAIPVAVSLIAGARASSDGLRGGVIGVRAARRSTSVGLEALIDPAIDVPNATISAIGGSLAACLHRDGGLGVCAVLDGGVIRAKGRGIEQPANAVLPMLSGGIRAEWVSPSWSIFRVVVRAELDVTILRDRFEINGMDVWHTEAFAGQIGAALIAQIP